MSRIGNQPIHIPDGVNVNISGSEVTVKGPKGELSGAFSKDINITESDGNVLVLSLIHISEPTRPY